MALTISATNSSLEKPINTIFEQTLLRNARMRCPYFLGTQGGEIQKHAGTATITWRRIENLAAATTALAELTSVASYMQGRSSAALSFTNYTATIQKYGNFVILNEEADIFNFNGQMDKIMEVIGINAGQSINQLQRNVAEGNLTTIFAGGAASGGAVTSAITYNSLRNAVTTIDKNYGMPFSAMTRGQDVVGTAPILDAMWLITHPDVSLDIAQMPGFKSVESYAGQVATVKGEFGFIGFAGIGVRCLSTAESTVTANGGGSLGSTGLYSTGGTTIDLYHTCIWGKDAIGTVSLGEEWPDGTFQAGDDLAPIELIVHELGSGGTSDPYNEIETIAWKAWHAGAVTNPNWGRLIVSGATDVTKT